MQKNFVEHAKPLEPTQKKLFNFDRKIIDFEHCGVGGLPSHEGEKAANTGDSRLLYDVSRHLHETKMNATMPVKDTSGQLLTDSADPPRVRRITRANTEAPSVV